MFADLATEMAGVLSALSAQELLRWYLFLKGNQRVFGIGLRG